MIHNYQPLTDIPSKLISIKLFYPEVSGLIPKLLKYSFLSSRNLMTYINVTDLVININLPLPLPLSINPRIKNLHVLLGLGEPCKTILLI